MQSRNSLFKISLVRCILEITITKFCSASQEVNYSYFSLTVVCYFTGTELLKAACVRADDGSLVSDHYCGGERPGDETLECNTQKCPAR